MARMSIRPGKASTGSATLAAQAYKQPADEINFEEEATQDASSFQDHMILLYGPPKIGKSTLASKLSGVYFLPTEPGYKALKVRKTPINNWATFVAFIKEMERSPKLARSVKCWVVDTADNLAKFCMQFVCGREGISHPSDEEWGKGWEAFRDEFTHWILRLTRLGPGTMFISHEQEREVISRGAKLSKMSPSLPGTCYKVLNNLVDIILHFGYAESIKTLATGKKRRVYTRCLFTKPSESRDAGDRTSMLPDEIHMENEQDAVNKIVSAFTKGKETNAKPKVIVRKK